MQTPLQAWGDFGDADGIVGLAFSDLLSDRKRNSTLLDSIAKAGEFVAVEFAVYLSSHDPHLSEESSSSFPSEITFGGPKPHLHTGPFQYHSLLDEHNYWAIRMLDFLVDGTSMTNCRESDLGDGTHGCRLVVDTGTSYLTAPPADAGRILPLMRPAAQGGCLDIEKLPTITYVLPDASYILVPHDYIVFGAGYDECVAGMAPLEVEQPLGPLWILGDIFLRKYYTHFHRDGAKVGFAPAINS